jgi:hypothetical protein
LRTAAVSEWNARKIRIVVLDVVTLACVSLNLDHAWHATKTVIVLETIVCSSVVRVRMVSWMTIATVMLVRIALRGVARVWHPLFVKLSWQLDPSVTKTRIVAQNTARGASFVTPSCRMECTVPVAATVSPTIVRGALGATRRCVWR